MKTRWIWVLCIVIALCLITPIVVWATPPQPYSLFGSVKLNGVDVPAGTSVQAFCAGVKYGDTTTFLDDTGESVYLMDIIGDDTGTPAVDGCLIGQTVVFKVTGYTADQEGSWQSGSAELNLTATSNGILTVTKTVNWNSITPDPAQSFEICITGPSHPSGNCQTTGHTGGALTWTNLLAGSYTVTETDPGVSWQVNGNGAAVNVPINQTASAGITNTRKLGSLQNTKSVQWNGVQSIPSQTFTICITGPSYPSPNCQVIGSSGGQLNWSNLIPGSYTVSENDPGTAWTVQVSGSPVSVPVDGGSGASTVTNTRKLGSLVITKAVNWNGIPSVPNQAYEICIQGPSYPTTPDCKTFTDPSILEQTWSNLVPGSYTISETNPGTMWSVVITGSPANVPVDGGQAAASVTNTRKRGSLQVAKSVNWNGVTNIPGQTFEVCISGPSFPAPAKDCKTFTYPSTLLQTWTNLIPGDYTVAETDPGNTWTVTPPSAVVSVPTDGGQASTSITNTRKLGSLKVVKSVEWNGVSAVPGQTFEICITGPSYPSTPNCKIYTDPGVLDQTWPNLIPGNYTVSETFPGSMWTVIVPTTPIPVPVDGGQASTTVSNTRKLGSLRITKAVSWNGVTPVPGQSFEICIQGPSYPVTKNCKTFTEPDTLDQTWSNLVPGSYTVTETNPGNMWAVVPPAAPVVVPVDGGEAAATVSNTRKLGNLEITKTVDWKAILPATKTFQICIQGPSYPTTKDCKLFTYPGDLVKTWNNLIPGNYDVTETTPGDEWAVGVTGSPANVPVDAGTALASVSNTRKLGSLQITKDVDWLGYTPDPAKTFTICITGPSYTSGNCKPIGHLGGLLSWSNLLPGSYTVTENNPGPEWQVAISGSPANVPINGGTANASVANARTENGLLVTKTVNWNGIPPDTQMTFQICIQGPSYPNTPNCKTSDYDGGSLIWNSLLSGDYTVTEAALGPEWQVDITGSPATVPVGGGNATASISNSRKLGSLQVTKVVNWNGVPPEGSQQFEICVQGPSYNSPNCQAVDNAGGTVVWGSLAPGSYSVSEVYPGDAWDTQVTGSPATIPITGGAQAASVSNTRRLGGLSISTAVDWNGITPDPLAAFQVCINGPSHPTPNCQAVGYLGGTSTWNGLIPGSYAITQNFGAEWAVNIQPTPAAVPINGGTANVNILSQRKLGSLQVTKTVEWFGYAPEPGTTFLICITGPTYPTGDCRPTGYQGGPVTWSNLLPGSYAVNELNPGNEWQVVVNGSPAVVPTNGGSANAGVANARKNNGLLVRKTVNWNGIPPDANKSFEICILGPSFPTQPSCKPIGYNGGLLTWTSLIPGNYDVNETTPGSEWQVVVDGSPGVVPDDGSNGSAEVTNTRKLGQLEVSIAVNWSGSTPNPAKQFTVCIQGPSYPASPDCQDIGYNGGTLTWSNLIPGQYTITEPSPGIDWQVTINGSPAGVPIDGGAVGATVTNVLNPGPKIYLPVLNK